MAKKKDDKNILGVSFDALISDEPIRVLPSPPNTLLPRDPNKNKRKKNEIKVIESTGMSTVDKGEVGVVETLSTYSETNDKLKETIAQIDIVASDLKKELDAVRTSRTMKGRYQYIGNFTDSMGSLLSTKIQAIKELNNSIKASNELDYKKIKDNKELSNTNNDAIIQGLYTNFVSNPTNQGAGRHILGPNNQQMTIAGSTGISMVNQPNNPLDMGYQQFQSNMSPEVHRMILDSNPAIKEVVVFDQSTGRKWFDVIDINTGESVPNMPHMDNMFLEDTTIDVRNNVARNINLNKTWQLVVRNSGANFGEY